MCILIHQPKGLSFSKGELRDFLHHNPDGFGYMFGDGKKLHVKKIAGNDKAAIRMYYQNVAGRDAILHFRMKTHGPVTAENAHPFFITPSIAMAHNGILDIGNPVDESKTDTWHLINFFIRPVAENHPEWLFDPNWLEMLGELIGTSNKLAFVHADGRTSLVNEPDGVKYKGAWFSNTYAWSAPKALKSNLSSYGGYGSRWSRDDDEDSELWWTRNPSSGARMQDLPAKQEEPAKEESADTDAESPYLPNSRKVAGILATLIGIYQRGGSLELASWMGKYPKLAAQVILEWYEYDTEQSAVEYIEEHLASAVDMMEGIIQTMLAHEESEESDEPELELIDWVANG
jgi:hypothetical protein